MNRDGLAVVIVFSIALFSAWLLTGNVFVMAGDEAIYLEGARSLLEGKVLYKDHFAFTGPGTYWFLAVCFDLFGYTIAAGRIPFLFAIAITTTFVYWLVTRFVTRRIGLFAALLCFAIETANPSIQNTSHRWDSAGFACIAIGLACHSRRSGRWSPFLSGVFAAAAAWCSPPVVFAGAVLAVWYWRLNSVLPYLAGGAVCSAVSVSILAASGSLPFLIPSLLWASRNYSDVNRVPYGFVVGGLEGIFTGGNAEFFVFAALILTAILAPAICPVLNILATREILRGPSEVGLIAACSFALVASSYPRWDTNHLTFVMAPALVVSVWLLTRWRAGKYVAAVIGTSAAMLLYYTATTCLRADQRTTRSGVVRGSTEQLNSLALAQAAIPAGASLFAYPYMPMMYFATGAVNRTPYPFLFPGMMKEADEKAVLESLQRTPPEYVMFRLMEAGELLRIFPNMNTNRFRMPAVESWIQEHYAPDASAIEIDGYKLYHRRRPPTQKAPRVSGASKCRRTAA